MSTPAHRAFKTPADLDAWLAKNHAKETELWVRMYKKASGTPSVTWDDCVVACLTWGWIDGLVRRLDDVSYIQRMTPRRPKSLWSTRNREIAERLLAEKKMKPTGIAQVEAAKADGRWQGAYAGPATATIPDDFLAVLNKNPAAKKAFASLGKTALYTIYFSVHTASTPETRARRIGKIVARLAAQPAEPRKVSRTKTKVRGS